MLIQICSASKTFCESSTVYSNTSPHCMNFFPVLQASVVTKHLAKINNFVFCSDIVAQLERTSDKSQVQILSGSQCLFIII